MPRYSEKEEKKKFRGKGGGENLRGERAANKRKTLNLKTLIFSPEPPGTVPSLGQKNRETREPHPPTPASFSFGPTKAPFIKKKPKDFSSRRHPLLFFGQN
jgi:hypothetical protein